MRGFLNFAFLPSDSGLVACCCVLSLQGAPRTLARKSCRHLSQACRTTSLRLWLEATLPRVEVRAAYCASPVCRDGAAAVRLLRRHLWEAGKVLRSVLCAA